MTETTIRLSFPFRMCVVGSSSSGKSQYCIDLLCSDDKFEGKIDKIYYIFSCFQPKYTAKLQQKFGAENVLLINNSIPDYFNENNFFSGNSVVVIDDALQLLSDNLLNLITATSHHQNVAVLFCVQTLTMSQNGILRILLRNCTHLTLFYLGFARDQVQLLSQRLFPARKKAFLQFYNEEMRHQKYAYILINLTPECHDELRVLTNFLQNLPPYLVGTWQESCPRNRVFILH